MKPKRYITVPAILLAYLAAMAIMGVKGLKTGQTPLWLYITVIAVTLLVIFTIYKRLKKRGR